MSFGPKTSALLHFLRVPSHCHAHCRWAVVHQAWWSIMPISSFLQHIECGQDWMWPKTPDNPGETFLHLHVINELVVRHHAKATLHRLLGDGVKVLSKRVKCHMQEPHYQVLQQMSSTCQWEMHQTNTHWSSLLSFWSLKTSKCFEAQSRLL